MVVVIMVVVVVSVLSDSCELYEEKSDADGG